MKAKAYLEKVKSILDERGWYQGGLFKYDADLHKYEFDGPVCLVGAMSLAEGWEPNNNLDRAYSIVDRDFKPFQPAENINEEHKTAKEFLLECIESVSGFHLGYPSNIPDFNDNSETKEEDIYNAIECAIRKA